MRNHAERIVGRNNSPVRGSVKAPPSSDIAFSAQAGVDPSGRFPARLENGDLRLLDQSVPICARHLDSGSRRVNAPLL